jgi:hypothetical protein
MTQISELPLGEVLPLEKVTKCGERANTIAVILATASIGIERIAPGMPHIQNQKTSEMTRGRD